MKEGGRAGTPIPPRKRRQPTPLPRSSDQDGGLRERGMKREARHVKEALVTSVLNVLYKPG